MFPRANELNMVSDNGVSNNKDLKGVFTTITDSTSYPKTPYYMDKSTDRENSVTIPKRDIQPTSPSDRSIELCSML